MNRKKRRTWCYVMDPCAYEISCDICNGYNLAWSEYCGLVWCYDCKIDTRGNEGIFGGPIPFEIAKMFGTTFDRLYFKSKTIKEMKIVGNKIVYRKKK